MLHTYVDAWHGSADAVLDLLTGLDASDWDQPTDLPGWSVGDVAAHLAHLEAVLAGIVEDAVPPNFGTVVASVYTEAGVAERRGRSQAEVIAELRAGVDARAEQLATLPTDPSARAARTPAGVPWTWDTLLRNRVVDVWCHEQDIRRAVGRRGGLDSPAAVVTTHTFAGGMPYVLGKKVGAVAGTSVRWDLTGDITLEIGATVDDDGRAKAGVPSDPTATLTLSSEDFAILAGGRREPGAVAVKLDGDLDLALRVVEQMTLTF